MNKVAAGRRWWGDLFARLVITVVGGVMVAVIVTVLIPRLLEQNDTQPAPTEQDAPVQASDGQEEAPSDTEPPAEEPAPDSTGQGG